MDKPGATNQSLSNWNHDSMNLQALEDKLRIEIDPAFFEPEQDFRTKVLKNGVFHVNCTTDVDPFDQRHLWRIILSPFNQVIEILSVSLDQDKESEESPDFDQLAGNPLHRNIQRQLQVCTDVVERITVEHHGSLNSSVQAMGGVARHYDQTRANVGTLREQLRECKHLLQTGASQADIRELWQRKVQYSLVLRLLNALDMIKDAPVKFERLVRQKRFIGAVDLLNGSLLNIFSPELVDVPAVASVRDEMLVEKGRILDVLVEEIADVLFLRAATAQFNSTEKARGSLQARRRRERGGAVGAPTDEVSRAQGTGAVSSAGMSSDVASESSAGAGGVDAAGMAWAGIQVDVTDVGDHEEQALDEPSREFSVYLRLLVEAVRRLRCLDDIERFLLERLPSEVLTLSATHMRTCVGRHEEDGFKSRGGGVHVVRRSKNDAASAQNLAQYLSLVFDSFTCVLANLVRLVRLLHAARLRDLRDSDPGTPVFEADVSYKESLVTGLWQHMQTHLTDVLGRHVADDADRSDGAIDASKGDVGRAQIARPTSTPSGTEPFNLSSSVSYFRPLRRPEVSSPGLTSTAMELDQASAAHYCTSNLLALPSPLILINIFRPSLKFVEVEQTIVSAVKKEVFEAGHIRRDRGSRQAAPEGIDDEGGSLMAFIHATARQKLLPVLSMDCRAMNAQLIGDNDSFFPASMASGSQAATERGTSNRLTSRERIPVDGAMLRPSRGAEDIYTQARTLFKAMVQMPPYADEIGEILFASLEDYCSMVQNKFQDIIVNSATRSRLERFSDKLRDLLRRDADYLMYKTRVYGDQLRWDEGEEINALQTNGSVQRAFGGGGRFKNVDRQDLRHVAGGTTNSSAEEEADEVFESEFVMLKDLWKFDSVPFPVTKQSLLSLRKQQAVACLAFSCDWLAHKLLKMCAVVTNRTAATSDGQIMDGGSSSKRLPGSECRTSNLTSDIFAPGHKLRQTARKLSRLADDSLLCLRLEVYMLVSYHMQQLHSIDLEVASGQGSTTAMSLGSVEDQCVVNLNRCIREEQEALSPFESKGSLALLCPKELLAYVLAPLPRLLPRLFIHSFSFRVTKNVTVGGIGKLNKILNTLQQTVGDVVEDHKPIGHEEIAVSANHLPRTRPSTHARTIAGRFGWARQYMALISMPHIELEAYIRKNRTRYSKEEYRMLWSTAGPNRRTSDGGSGIKFDSWWTSERL